MTSGQKALTVSQTAEICTSASAMAVDTFPVDSCRLTEAEWVAVNSDLHLSSRELDIAQHLMLGRSETGIAIQLGISPNTVHTHLGRVYKKLGVRSAAGFLRRVFAVYIQWSRSQ